MYSTPTSLSVTKEVSVKRALVALFLVGTLLVPVPGHAKKADCTAVADAVMTIAHAQTKGDVAEALAHAGVNREDAVNLAAATPDLEMMKNFGYQILSRSVTTCLQEGMGK